MEKTSTLSLDTTIKFESVNALLAAQKEIEAPANITIQSLKMRGDTEWIYVVADVTGPYSGQVILQFKLEFDNGPKRFAIKDLNLELADDNAFAKMAGKFVINMFGDKLDAMLQDMVNKKFAAMLEDVFQQVRKLPLNKNGFIGFDTKSYNLFDLRTDTSGLYFVAELTGIGKLEY